MKSLVALAAVLTALAFAVPAGAMPLYDHPGTPHTEAVPPPAADGSEGASLLVVAIIGGVAFLTGAAASRLVAAPRRRVAAN